MGLSSKLVYSTEVLELDNWSCSKSLRQDDPPMPISTKQPPPQPGPVRRHPQQSHHRNPSDPLKCPRCDSMNTKFCYYNNYNKSQPRHFCKSCKRHWTKGGTLRNVPVGGGSKTKRLKTSSTATPSATFPEAVAAHSVSTSVGVLQGSSEHSSNDSRDDDLVSLPPGNQDSLNYMCFPLPTSSEYACNGRGFISDMEDSIIASVLSTAPLSTWHTGIGSGTAAPPASLWSWEDIDTLVSTTEGVPWDEYWGV